MVLDFDKNKLTIGVLGGMGSYATLHLFKRLLDAFPAEKEWGRPRIIIDNRCTMPSRVRAVIYNERREELVNAMSDSVSRLLDYGCDKIILDCNTSHIFLNEVLSRSSCPPGVVFDMIEILAENMSRAGIKEAGLLATEGTFSSRVFDKYFSPKSIRLINPSTDKFKTIRLFIESVKTQAVDRKIRSHFVDFLKKMNCRDIILGCTELPVIYEQAKNEVNDAKIKIWDPLEQVILRIKEFAGRNAGACV